jgi:DNA-binding NarL/FixJ family response regulator
MRSSPFPVIVMCTFALHWAAARAGRLPGEAFDLPARPPCGGPAAAALTPRELEIAALVRDGLTNRQIAALLVVSDRTVATHVSNALGKLSLRSRTQLAMWMAAR